MRSNLSFFLLFFLAQLYGQSNEYGFKIDSLKKIILTSKVNDSSTVATSYYKIGELYRLSSLSDSAYYHYHKAEKIYKSLGNDFQTAVTLYWIAVIQRNEKNYMGSEIISIEAISLLENQKESNQVNKYKSYIYNNLGIVFNGD